MTQTKTFQTAPRGMVEGVFGPTKKYNPETDPDGWNKGEYYPDYDESMGRPTVSDAYPMWIKNPRTQKPMLNPKSAAVQRIMNTETNGGLFTYGDALNMSMKQGGTLNYFNYFK